MKRLIIAFSIACIPQASLAQPMPCGYGPYGPIPCDQRPYPGPHMEGIPPRYVGPTPFPNYLGRGAPIRPWVVPRYHERPWPYCDDWYGSRYDRCY